MSHGLSKCTTIIIVLVSRRMSGTNDSDSAHVGAPAHNRLRGPIYCETTELSERSFMEEEGDSIEAERSVNEFPQNKVRSPKARELPTTAFTRELESALSKGHLVQEHPPPFVRDVAPNKSRGSSENAHVGETAHTEGESGDVALATTIKPVSNTLDNGRVSADGDELRPPPFLPPVHTVELTRDDNEHSDSDLDLGAYGAYSSDDFPHEADPTGIEVKPRDFLSMKDPRESTEGSNTRLRLVTAKTRNKNGKSSNSKRIGSLKKDNGIDKSMTRTRTRTRVQTAARTSEPAVTASAAFTGLRIDIPKPGVLSRLDGPLYAEDSDSDSDSSSLDIIADVYGGISSDDAYSRQNSHDTVSSAHKGYSYARQNSHEGFSNSHNISSQKGQATGSLWLPPFAGQEPPLSSVSYKPPSGAYSRQTSYDSVSSANNTAGLLPMADKADARGVAPPPPPDVTGKPSAAHRPSPERVFLQKAFLSSSGILAPKGAVAGSQSPKGTAAGSRSPLVPPPPPLIHMKSSPNMVPTPFLSIGGNQVEKAKTSKEVSGQKSARAKEVASPKKLCLMLPAPLRFSRRNSIEKDTESVNSKSVANPEPPREENAGEASRDRRMSGKRDLRLDSLAALLTKGAPVTKSLTHAVEGAAPQKKKGTSRLSKTRPPSLHAVQFDMNAHATKGGNSEAEKVPPKFTAETEPESDFQEEAELQVILEAPHERSNSNLNSDSGSSDSDGSGIFGSEIGGARHKTLSKRKTGSNAKIQAILGEIFPIAEGVTDANLKGDSLKDSGTVLLPDDTLAPPMLTTQKSFLEPESEQRRQVCCVPPPELLSFFFSSAGTSG